MAAKPVVLLGHVRQRALAGQRERRHARRAGRAARSARRSRPARPIASAHGVGATDAGHGARVYGAAPCRPPSAPRRSATRTRATTTWRPSTTTPSGASTSASSAARRSRAKLRKALGREPGRYARSLEIGAGTGYFTLNLLRAGLIGQATCSDISPGMLDDAAGQRASGSGCDVRTEPADAERLPFADASFDLVLGHAVLHHIPDLPRAFAEFERVLAPGGTLAVRRRALALRRPPRARAQARRRRASRRCGAARSVRAPAREDVARTTRPRSRRSSTSTPSPPASCTRLAREAGLARRARHRRGAAGELVRLDQPHARGERRAPMTCRGPGASTPTAATCCCSSSTAACWSRACRPAIFYNLMLAATQADRRLDPRAPLSSYRQVTDLLGDLQHEQRELVKHRRLAGGVVGEAHAAVFVAQRDS